MQHIIKTGTFCEAHLVLVYIKLRASVKLSVKKGCGCDNLGLMNISIVLYAIMLALLNILNFRFITLCIEPIFQIFFIVVQVPDKKVAEDELL